MRTCSYSCPPRLDTMPRRPTVLPWRTCLLLSVLQPPLQLVTCQSFAELAAVTFGGPDGAGSILPYSSTSLAAGGNQYPVDPLVLNVLPRQPGSVDELWNNRLIREDSGPVLHYLPRIFGTSRIPLKEPRYSVPPWREGGGGRLVDPPNRSSLWREGVSGAAINLRDNHLDCGADHVPLSHTRGPTPSLACGVCGDSPIGRKNHVIGGRYVGNSPYVARRYASGGTMEVTFYLNHTVVPGVDRVTFFLCPIRQRNSDISWQCVSGERRGGGGSLKIDGWGNAYLPERPGVHKVRLILPPSLACSRCVLQWRWRTSRLADRQQCAGQSWLRACSNPIHYINCADISITKAAATFGVDAFSQFMLLAGLVNS